ncbi:MAG: VTT domain-containing protein [Gemmatimonadaceae bacterium]
MRRTPRFPLEHVRTLVKLAIVPAVIVIALLLAWKFGYFELDRRQQLLERVQRLRVIPGVEMGFMAAFALAVTLCLPATVVTILGGAVFGPRFGALFALAGAMVGTCIAFSVARTVARRPINRIFGEHRLFTQLREQAGVLALFRLRVLPIAPFGVLPYVAGIADVSLRRLLVATLIGSLPSVIAYSYVGSELLIAAAYGGDASRRSLWIALGVTGGMLALSAVPQLLRRRGTPSPGAPR